jgi:hypothetical protein
MAMVQQGPAHFTLTMQQCRPEVILDLSTWRYCTLHPAKICSRKKPSFCAGKQQLQHAVQPVPNGGKRTRGQFFEDQRVQNVHPGDTRSSADHISIPAVCRLDDFLGARRPSTALRTKRDACDRLAIVVRVFPAQHTNVLSSVT